MPRRSSQQRTRPPQTPLAAVLGEQGRRLAWVADRLGVDASTVSRWCSGDRSIPPIRRTQLAALLQVDAAALVDPIDPIDRDHAITARMESA